MDEIASTGSWKPTLLTLEIGLIIGARGSRTYHSFISLGLSSTHAKKLCKTLSVVCARCSYAIFLAHKDTVWCKADLVVVDDLASLESQLEPAARKTS